MAKIDKVEKEKRTRIVMDWIIQDLTYYDIIAKIGKKWGLEARQAKRYIRDARKQWEGNADEELQAKINRKIITLKRLKNSLKKEFEGTPAGIRAIVVVEKEIIALEKMYPATKVQLSDPNGDPVQPQIIYVRQTNVDYSKLSPATLLEVVGAKIIPAEAHS